MFIAIAIGIVLYMILLSTHVIKFNLFLVNFFKKFTRKLFNIIIIPFNYIYMIIRKVFFKPISFIFINVRKISTNLYKKPIKISNKIENKGGF